jgi:hypothetical protein
MCCTKEACNGIMSTVAQVIATVQSGKVVVDGIIGRRVARIAGIAKTYRECENCLPGLKQSLSDLEVVELSEEYTLQSTYVIFRSLSFEQ